MKSGISGGTSGILVNGTDTNVPEDTLFASWLALVVTGMTSELIFDKSDFALDEDMFSGTIIWTEDLLGSIAGGGIIFESFCKLQLPFPDELRLEAGHINTGCTFSQSSLAEFAIFIEFSFTLLSPEAVSELAETSTTSEQEEVASVMSEFAFCTGGKDETIDVRGVYVNECGSLALLPDTTLIFAETGSVLSRTL